MSGLSLNMGLQGAGGYGSAATPAAAGTSPQGPTTIGAKAFGITTAGAGGGTVGPIALMSVGFLSLVGLVYIWWSLPR